MHPLTRPIRMRAPHWWNKRHLPNCYRSQTTGPHQQALVFRLMPHLCHFIFPSELRYFSVRIKSNLFTPSNFPNGYWSDGLESITMPLQTVAGLQMINDSRGVIIAEKERFQCSTHLSCNISGTKTWQQAQNRIITSLLSNSTKTHAGIISDNSS